MAASFRGPASRDVVSAYVGLTKPRIIELLLVTTVPAMFLAAGGVPPLMLVVNTMIGGCLAAASANAFNCVLDRDIDERMRRTRRRPLPRHAVGPRAATIFAVVLGDRRHALARLSSSTGCRPAWRSGANAFYILVYTMWLKRRTPQNIVWGGIAGCFPPLIGWTAVTGSISVGAAGAVPDRLLLDAAAHLGAGHALPGGLRGGRGADAAGGPVGSGGGPPDHDLLSADGAGLAGAVADRRHRLAVPGRSPWSSARRCSGSPPSCWRRAGRGLTDAALKPMRLFHWSNSYLALVFVAAAVDPLLR